MSKDIILGIGDYVVTDDIDATVKVYALGSCVALILYAPIQRCLAMVHIMTPRTTSGTVITPSNRGLFADVVVPWLIEEFLKKTGGSKIYQAGIVGGAKGIMNLELMAIGEKNLSRVLKCLSEYGVSPAFQDVGGAYIRNIETEIATGIVKVQRKPFQRIGSLASEAEKVNNSSETVYRLGNRTEISLEKPKIRASKKRLS